MSRGDILPDNAESLVIQGSWDERRHNPKVFSLPYKYMYHWQDRAKVDF